MRRLASIVREPITILTRSKVKATFKKEKASSSSVLLELMLPYLDVVAVKPYPFRYKVPKFQKFDGRKGDSKEHVLLNLIGPLPTIPHYA